MNFHHKPITHISNVCINVQDLNRSIAFYRKVIGLQVLSQTDRFATLTADGETGILSIKQPEDVRPKQRKTTGLYHFALLLPTRSDLADITQHFMNNGVPFSSADHLVSEALYLSDPDGNGIEIYADRDSAAWHWDGKEVKMTVDPLDFKNLLMDVKQQTWDQIPAGTIIGHIHLHVAELKQTEKFYCKGLGFEAVSSFGDQALFIADGKYHHHIGLNTWAGVGAPTPAPNSVGLDSFTLMLASEGKRNDVLNQLKEIGAPIMTEDGYFTVYDPSGNCIHLKV